MPIYILQLFQFFIGIINIVQNEKLGGLLRWLLSYSISYSLTSKSLNHKIIFAYPSLFLFAFDEMYRKVMFVV